MKMYMYGKHRYMWILIEGHGLENLRWKTSWKVLLGNIHWEARKSMVYTYEFSWKLCMNETENEVEIDNDDEA